MELSYERLGSGDPVVLVHGITERGETWRPVVASLAARHELLIVDLRGHGSSAASEPYDPLTFAADVHETVTATAFGGATAPVMIGHSLGGVVVSAYAAAFDTRGVINVDQSLHLAAFKDALAPIEPMVRGDEASFQQAILLVFSMMNGPLPAAEVERVLALRRPDQAVVSGVWGTVFDSTADELDAQVGELAGGVSVPYLSLHGEDPGPDYAAWLAELIPTAVVEVWAEHGHYPHLVDPARFVDRVDAFIASL